MRPETVVTQIQAATQRSLNDTELLNWIRAGANVNARSPGGKTALMLCTFSPQTVQTLIKAGAFDGMGGARSQWMSALDRALQSGASALADYEWNFSNPVIVPGKGATFIATGKLKYASSEEK